MFSRKLTALNYHSPCEYRSLGKTEDLKPLVVWLEDQKIRSYKIEDRRTLRENEGQEWVACFRKYLREMECPHRVETDLPAVVDWLLGVALRYEFNEVAESNPDLQHEVGQATSVSPLQQLSQSAKSPLDIDESDSIFISGTQALAKLLRVTSHPDPSILLEAIRIVILEKLTESALGNSAKSDKELKGGKRYTITAKECGFDLGDPVLNEAAKVLRLLHIHELRQLQTRINELIVAVQAITADPKTDQSLGQVGR